jgi:hypothetical protein
MAPSKISWGARLRPPPPPISKSDHEFLQMGLEFMSSRDGIRVSELNELFDKVRGQQ